MEPGGGTILDDPCQFGIDSSKFGLIYLKPPPAVLNLRLSSTSDPPESHQAQQQQQSCPPPWRSSGGRSPQHRLKASQREASGGGGGGGGTAADDKTVGASAKPFRGPQHEKADGECWEDLDGFDFDSGSDFGDKCVSRGGAGGGDDDEEEEDGGGGLTAWTVSVGPDVPDRRLSVELLEAHNKTFAKENNWIGFRSDSVEGAEK